MGGTGEEPGSQPQLCSYLAVWPGTSCQATLVCVASCSAAWAKFFPLLLISEVSCLCPQADLGDRWNEVVAASMVPLLGPTSLYVQGVQLAREGHPCHVPTFRHWDELQCVLAQLVHLLVWEDCV